MVSEYIDDIIIFFKDTNIVIIMQGIIFIFTVFLDEFLKISLEYCVMDILYSLFKVVLVVYSSL